MSLLYWESSNWVEGKDYPLWSAGNAPPNVSQEAVDLCSEGTFVAHVCLGVHKGDFHRSEKLFSSPHSWGCSSTDGGIHTCWTSQDSFQLIFPAYLGCAGWQHSPLVRQPLSLVCVISKFSEGSFCPFILIVNKDVKQNWMLYWPLE